MLYIVNYVKSRITFPPPIFIAHCSPILSSRLPCLLVLSRGTQVREVTVIAKAKVPLVKFVHVASGMQVDVCFQQKSGLTSGSAAKELMRQMPPVW